METTAEIEQIFRDQFTGLFAWLVRSLRDFDATEDALQEAFLIALRRWPADGVPAEPPGVAGGDGPQLRDRSHAT